MQSIANPRNILAALPTFDTTLKKKRAIGLVLLATLLVLFLLFNRIDKLDVVEDDLAVISATEIECFQGFCIETGPDTSLASRWWEFSITYLQLVALGMTFAFLVAGLTEAFLFPKDNGQPFTGSGIKGSLKGLLIGSPMSLCSACIVPVSSAFRRKGAGIETTLAITLGSSTLNLPAILMAILIFTPMLAGSRIVLSIMAGLLIGPVVAILIKQRRAGAPGSYLAAADLVDQENAPWTRALTEGVRVWIKTSLKYLIRLGPIMVIAGFVSGLAIQWVSRDTVGTYLGDNVLGIVIAATLGILINVPLMFEIPLVAALLLVGMGTGPAVTLLFVAAAGGPITFWGLARVMPKRVIAAFATATWGLGLVGGLAVLLLNPLIPGVDFGLRPNEREVPVVTREVFDSGNNFVLEIPTDWVDATREVRSTAAAAVGGDDYSTSLVLIVGKPSRFGENPNIYVYRRFVGSDANLEQLVGPQVDQFLLDNPEAELDDRSSSTFAGYESQEVLFSELDYRTLQVYLLKDKLEWLFQCFWASYHPKGEESCKEALYSTRFLTERERLVTLPRDSIDAPLPMVNPFNSIIGNYQGSGQAYTDPFLAPARWRVDWQAVSTEPVDFKISLLERSTGDDLGLLVDERVTSASGYLFVEWTEKLDFYLLNVSGPSEEQGWWSVILTRYPPENSRPVP